MLWRKPVRGVSILRKVVLFLIVDVIQSNPDMLRAYTLRDVVDLLNNPFNRCAAITMEIAHAIDANYTTNLRTTINHRISDVAEVWIESANIRMTENDELGRNFHDSQSGPLIYMGAVDYDPDLLTFGNQTNPERRQGCRRIVATTRSFISSGLRFDKIGLAPAKSNAIASLPSRAAINTSSTERTSKNCCDLSICRRNDVKTDNI